MSLEDSLFRDKKIRSFMQPIREKEIENVLKTLCLLGVEVFTDRNPTLAHYSLKQIQRCLNNFMEESKLLDL